MRKCTLELTHEPCRILHVGRPGDTVAIGSSRVDPPVCGKPVAVVFSTGWRARADHAAQLRVLVPLMAIKITEAAP
jgi:hypothetical protein